MGSPHARVEGVPTSKPPRTDLPVFAFPFFLRSRSGRRLHLRAAALRGTPSGGSKAFEASVA